MSSREKKNTKDLFHTQIKSVKKYTPKPVKSVYRKIRRQQSNVKPKVSEDKRPTLDDFRYRLYNLGFADQALHDIETMINSHETSADVKLLSAWELAVWFANTGKRVDSQRALKYIEFIEQRPELSLIDPSRIAVIKAECLRRDKKSAAANAVLDQYLSKDTNINVILARLNATSNISQKIQTLNSLYTDAGLSTITLLEGAGAPYDRLALKSAKSLTRKQEAKVTVIFPVYNASKYISLALKSIQEQSWKNLEIIVVDDCSTDNTKEIIQKHANQDDRIIFIENKINSGPYVARNNALDIATGDFITVHDSDDWSHPDKIAYQVEALLASPEKIGNVSQWARATDDLVFFRRGNPGYFVQLNISSLMLRRKELAEKFGYWDAVRFGADTELYHRIRRQLGPSSIQELAPIPLSFGRHAENSLTNNSAFGYPGFLMGARKVYSESTSFHLNSPEPRTLTYIDSSRELYAPMPMLPKYKKGQIDKFDIVFVGDFTVSNSLFYQSALKQIKLLRGTKTSLGIVQVSRYSNSFKRPATSEILSLLNSGYLEYLVYGQTVTSTTAVIDADILQEEQHYIPTVTAKNTLLVLYQSPLADEVRLVTKFAKKHFSTKGIWCAGDNTSLILPPPEIQSMPFYSLSWQDIATHVGAPSIQNIDSGMALAQIIDIKQLNPFTTTRDDLITVVDTKNLTNIPTSYRDVTVIMPCLDEEKGINAAHLLVQRAGMKCHVIVAVDSIRQGFIKTLNETAKHLNTRYVIYLAEDAYPGRDWLRIAFETIENSNSGLLCFNDGKWHGRIASFGMVKKSWISEYYKDQILSSAYKSHKADNEITVIAKVTNNYIYEPRSLLAEYDPSKDLKGSNLDDDAIFQSRFLNKFGLELDQTRVDALKAEYKIY